MQNSIEFALQSDKTDELSAYRDKFHIPAVNGQYALYFTGNSLGLQPKSVKTHLMQELDDWAEFGVEGHFEAKNPWVSYHKILSEPFAKLVGAQPKEVVAMNGLSVNLHLMMVSFYQPQGKRTKIICEAKAFPSDQYVLESQVKFHGLKPEDVIVEVSPREGEHCIREEDILSCIEEVGDELALVFWGGVNYYTGQVFDMPKITKVAKGVGAYVGFDLAHGVGNVSLDLHDWGVDFACWCSYKYLNSGPGSVSGVFVHSKHENNTDLPRFAGWWGHDEERRFLMEKGFVPMQGAQGWQLSNAAVFSMAPCKASMDIFDEVGMPKLIEKSRKLTNFMEFIFNDISSRYDNCNFEIITPKEEKYRGCQLSILMHGQGKEMFDYITNEGVIADWREPNVIRLAPVPLYNSFEDIFKLGQIIENAIS
ncbi:MAG: kynureninase [Flavobacteriales bacterium]|nr:kynureninase [Flavobacteriales bacterium]MBL6872907.1 kynureninase [Flavobacteriales bacterium]